MAVAMAPGPVASLVVVPAFYSDQDPISKGVKTPPMIENNSPIYCAVYGFLTKNLFLINSPRIQWSDLQ